MKCIQKRRYPMANQTTESDCMRSQKYKDHTWTMVLCALSAISRSSRGTVSKR